MTEKKKKPAGPSYSEATAELDDILREIESGEIDLDVLSEQVERAATLLATCRQKLAATETRVRRVVDDMSAAMDSATDAEDGEGEGEQ